MESQPASQRPVYIIAHGCNSLKKINKALEQGVNAIECDLFADKHHKWWVSHSGFFKTDLLVWLKHIEDVRKNLGTRLALIIFDIKSQAPFTQARATINEVLGTDQPRLYSTANFKKASIFPPILSLLHEREAVAIDEEDDPAAVAGFFSRHGAKQFWYGNGISYIPINRPFHKAMQQAAAIRSEEHTIAKIYTWTVHRKAALEKYLLNDGVDGVMVDLNNFFTAPVKNALQIVHASKNLVLATATTPLHS